MSLKHIADHIAAQGRHGDSTLVHVSKGELAGLQALARKNGTTLTVNPQTGLPEAFGLRNLLPMAVGYALGGPMGMSAMQAGLAVGGVSALASGSLKQGMMDGLGAWGGAGLAAAPAAAATTGTASTVGAGTAGTVGAGTTGTVANGLGGTYTAPAIEPISGTVSSTANFAAPTIQPISTYPPAGVDGVVTGPAYEGAGLKAATAPATTGAYNVSPANLSGAAPATQTGVLPGLKAGFNTFAANAAAHPGYLAAALAPAIGEELFKKPEGVQPGKQCDADMGQRYQFSPSSQYAAPRYVPISNEAARKLYGYAEGGLTSLQAGGGTVEQMSNANAIGANTRYPQSDLHSAAYATPWQTPQSTNIVTDASDTGVNSMTGEQQFAYGGAIRMSGGGDAGKQRAVIGALENSGFGAAEQVARNATFLNTPTPQLQALARYRNAEGGEPVQEMAAGGISTLGSYSDGGRLLKGPGDGMSDNIPAQIGQKQPARLADGEFVVPADVVSHLGNGSTDAGAKQLYKMMDKVRAARTGRKSQGKQINPNKYMPA